MYRLLREFATVSVLVVLSKPDSIACIKGVHSVICLFPTDCFTSSSGAATTASRLGQPDLAIATLNDFVQVRNLGFELKISLIHQPSGRFNGC